MSIKLESHPKLKGGVVIKFCLFLETVSSLAHWHMFKIHTFCGGSGVGAHAGAVVTQDVYSHSPFDNKLDLEIKVQWFEVHCLYG